MRSNLSLLVLIFLFSSQIVNAQSAVDGALLDSTLVDRTLAVNVTTGTIAINDVADAQPIQFIPYDQAKVINKEQSDTLNYLLALEPYKKRQNRWQAEKSIRLQGRLYRETHELASGFDEKDVYDFYKNQVPNTAKLVFECFRRDCAESNNWANDHFKIKQLYGLDEYQFYSVHQLGDDQYITLYVVRRGNRRVYTQIETLVSKP